MATATAATAGVPWCNTELPNVLTTRFTECDVRAVPVIIRTDGVLDAIACFTFLRMIELDGRNSFMGHLTIEPAQQVPPAFAEIDMKLAGTCAESRADLSNRAPTPGPRRCGGPAATFTPHR